MTAPVRVEGRTAGAGPGWAWDPAPGRLPRCGVDHGGRPGRFDESARRPDHPELSVAMLLVAEGHDVVSLPERGRRGPVADFVVCGLPVEVKALLTVDERVDRRPATARTVHNRLVSAADQAPVVVVSTRGSGCRVADAMAGLESFATSGRTGGVTAVRLLGDGFDLSWAAPRQRELRRVASASAADGRPVPASAPGRRAVARDRPDGRDVGAGPDPDVGRGRTRAAGRGPGLGPG